MAIDKVRIRPSGIAIVIEPIAEDWEWLDALPKRIDGDLVDAVLDTVVEQERPALDFFR